jgi:hypothetical protein
VHTIVLGISLLLAASAAALGAAPALISYQGRLTDTAGQPVTTLVNIQFTFWDAPSGGALLGSFIDSDPVTPDAGGVYSTLIGDEGGTVIPESIFDVTAVWLNVQINGEDLLPRQRMVSVGHALRARHADTAVTSTRALGADNADMLDGLNSAAFMPAAADNWVNTAGDTVTGNLIVTGASANARLDVTNSAASNSADAVRGEASGTGNIANFGGQFIAQGDTGRGIRAAALSTADAINYGGYFEANGVRGRGVFGLATGSAGWAVRGQATATGAAANVGGYFSADGDSGIAVQGTSLAEGFIVANYGGFFTAAGGSGRGVLGRGGVYGVQGEGSSFDFYASGAGTNYGPFTGAHEVQLGAGFPASPKTGLIVATAGPAKVRIDAKGRTSISSTLPTVRLADCPLDKTVLGVLVGETSLPKDHWYPAAAGDRFGVVNALGEGRVWVCDAAGPVEMGDYITTSTAPGYGQRQSDDLQHAYTVGKVIERVDWSQVTETIEINGQVYKVYLIAVVYHCG